MGSCLYTFFNRLASVIAIYLHMVFLFFFFLVELVRMVRVCDISFQICVRLGLARKETILVI